MIPLVYCIYKREHNHVYFSQREDLCVALTEIAHQKSGTLTHIALPGMQLTPDRAARLLSALPAVHVDLSNHGVMSSRDESTIAVDPLTRITGLHIGKNCFDPRFWWTSLPQYLVELNMSDLTLPSTAPVYPSLLTAIKALRAPIALRKLNVARTSAEYSFIAFMDMLQALLLSDHCKLKSLDISGTTATHTRFVELFSVTTYLIFVM